jgi:hypothetical protein
LSPRNVPSSRTTRALAARSERTEASLRRLEETLDAMVRNRQPINVSGVARQSGVSRTFLYEHSRARALVSEAMNAVAGLYVESCPWHHGALVASWRERAIRAEGLLASSQHQLALQDRRIAELLERLGEPCR